MFLFFPTARVSGSLSATPHTVRNGWKPNSLWKIGFARPPHPSAICLPPKPGRNLTPAGTIARANIVTTNSKNAATKPHKTFTFATRSLPLALCVIGAAAILGLTALLVRSTDETYQGKRLEFWLRGGQPPPQWLPATNWSPQQAEAAVRHLGNKAIPVLLRKLRARDSAITWRWRRLVKKQHLIKIEFIDSGRSNVAGYEGFKILGSAGAPAIPELIRIAEDQRCFLCRLYAIGSISCVGPAATNAIPSLIKLLSESNPTVRWNTALALGRIHESPELVVPAMITLLQDPDPNVRFDAIRALAAYGPAAASAIPELIHCSGDQAVARDARNALRAIRGDTLSPSPQHPEAPPVP